MTQPGHWIRAIWIGACVLVLPLLANAQDTIPDQRAQATITAQIEAFRAEDEVGAFAFASPFIQRLFETPENFGAMVRHGYPMVWAPEAFFFHDQVVRDGALWQQVQIVDQGGVEHWFAYELIEVDGAMRINGVYPIKAPEFSV